MSLDVARIREEFPGSKRQAYFRSNSMGLMPGTVRGALSEYCDVWEAKGSAAWDTFVPFVADAADELAALLGAPKGSMMLHQNTSIHMNAVLSALTPSGARNRVVYSDLEFPTIHYVAQRFGGLEPVVVRSPDHVRIEPEAIADAIDERTLLVMVCHVYFCSGWLLDVRPIVEKARKVGARVLLDVFQSAGTVPIDFTASGVDFGVTGSHKFLCGGSGAAGLYVRPDLLPELRPRQTGWLSHARPMAMEFGPFEDAPDMNRFMGGTPSIAALYQARCGWAAIRDAGVPEIRAHSQRLQRRVLATADELGWTVNSPRDEARRGGQVHVSTGDFAVDARVQQFLAGRQIAVDTRPAFNGIRIAPHLYNDDGDVQRLCDGLREFEKERRR